MRLFLPSYTGGHIADIGYNRPDAAAIRSRMLTIAFKSVLHLSTSRKVALTFSLSSSLRHREKMKIPANVIDQLVTGVNSDIRQVLNMLSTWKLSSSTMDFDEGKSL